MSTATTTETSELTESIETADIGATKAVDDERPAVSTRRSTGTGSRHGHRRAPKRRRGPVRLLLGVLRVPGWLVRHMRPSRLPWYGALVLGALIVAALVVDGMWWQSTKGPRAVNSARGDALVAATSAAQKVLSFDYRTMSADVARAKATATGPFLTQYEQTSASLMKEVGPAKAIVQASAQSCSVVHTFKGQVTVLCFVDQASVRQNAGQKTPVTRIDQARVQMTMVKEHGRWLVAQLSSL